MTDRSFKKVLRSCVVLAATMISTSLVLMPSHATAGSNLLLNPGFEQSALDPSGVIGYTNPQPLLPTSWAFEGASALFDHSQNGSHSGRRQAGISGNLAGTSSVCAPPPAGCQSDGPGELAKNTAALAYSATPAWRNALPIPVTQNTNYTASVWQSRSFVSLGGGVAIRVRWLTGAGQPLRIDTVASVTNTHDSPDIPTPWAQISGSVTSPVGAAQAVILLTYTNDLWIGNVVFDDVYFGTTGTTN
ncbi:MAG: hypothetical protein ABR507_02380 [Actinomycetota bacterium]|nr:hypothetical protein [Actinomycetota bacterium]